jgi:hypothetical protein
MREALREERGLLLGRELALAIAQIGAGLPRPARAHRLAGGAKPRDIPVEQHADGDRLADLERRRERERAWRLRAGRRPSCEREKNGKKHPAGPPDHSIGTTAEMLRGFTWEQD